MATYAGTDLGVVDHMDTAPNPKERQVNVYPGVNGLQLIDHGTRGATTVARGMLSASSASGLQSLLDTFRGYVTTGAKATLVDTFGTSWSNVLLVRFQPTGPRKPLQGGYFCTRYEAEFLHPDV